MLPLHLQSLMNCPTASEMCGYIQVHLHLLCGQHEEQQAEGHPECLEAQPVSRQWEEEGAPGRRDGLCHQSPAAGLTLKVCNSLAEGDHFC